MEETRFGDLLRRLRQAVDLSQEELAERAGLSMQTISALERGIRRAPYRHTIAALADALDLDEGDRSRLHSAAGRRHAGGVGPIVAQAAPRAVPPPAPDAPSAPETLPPALPDPTLIGRAAALAEATARLRGAAGRLLTIVGPGGVGKTRLALALAGAMTHEYADGATVVLLADLRDLTGVAAQVGRALGLPDRALDPVAALRVHLRERQILLILDNYEHLLPTAPLVADLLAAAPGLVVLATSRAPLRLRREEVYDLPPLACPDPAHPPAPEALADYGATALFVSRARAAYPDLAPTAADAATIAAICARLDGLPLALELAAARLNVLTPTGLLERLATRLPLLTRGARDLPERQRTLRAALDWSHDLLNAGEQALFRRLATFTGGATLVAIEAICAPPAPLEIELLDWLDGLVEQRLVRREGGDGESRFAMLETVREYAAERLAANAEDAATLLHRHSGYFLALAEEAASHLTGAKQERWTAILRADHDNLRAVLRRAIDGGDAATALRLAAALWRFWYAGGHWAEGRGWFRAVLALPSAADDATLTLARATILRAAGGIAIFQSDFGPAEEALRAALALARELGDSAGAATGAGRFPRVDPPA
jgi:predicted ATPase/transcriptional regulator with XRE-family HTH domain